MKAAISVQGVSKRFNLPHPDRPVTLQEAIIRGFRGLRTSREFWALKDINFQVAPGIMTGVIGRNGAGKSTLLRLIGKVGHPTSGFCHTNGRLGALIDLGAGFHPDLTGRENVFINGVISGLSRREIRQRFNSIVAFAELENFIDSPLRTFSTGMQMRLAFSTAIHTDPDILLIDEVLAVGDTAFQQKCLESIISQKNRGCAILLVSHDITLVGKMCDEAVWLQAGSLAAYGPAEIVTGIYIRSLYAETAQRTPDYITPRKLPEGSKLLLRKNRFGSLEMEITAVHLLDSNGLPVSSLNSGEQLHIQITYSAPNEIQDPIFGVTITRADGLVCYDTSTQNAGLLLPMIHGQGQVGLELERLDLTSGSYFVDVGVYQSDWSYAYDYHWQVYPLNINAPTIEKGIIRPPHQWTFASNKAEIPALKLNSE